MWAFWCIGRGQHKAYAPFYALSPRAKCDCGAAMTSYGQHDCPLVRAFTEVIHSHFASGEHARESGR